MMVLSLDFTIMLVALTRGAVAGVLDARNGFQLAR